MKLKDVEHKLVQADSFLTALTKLLKKHWGILTLICLGVFVYFFLSKILDSENPYEAVFENYSNETIIDSLSSLENLSLNDSIVLDSLKHVDIDTFEVEKRSPYIHYKEERLDKCSDLK